jgi:hypothetical protein
VARLVRTAKLSHNTLALAVVGLLALGVPSALLVSEKATTKRLRRDVATRDVTITAVRRELAVATGDLAKANTTITGLRGDLEAAHAATSSARSDTSEMQTIAAGLKDCESGLLGIMSDITNGSYTSALASPAWNTCTTAVRAYNSSSIASGTTS